MAELKIVKHSEILFRDLLRGMCIKNMSWPHPMESQVKWIVENMKQDDFHIFLTEEGADKAYMTISPVIGIANGKLTHFMGVGCVCSAKHGEGYGKQLMMCVNKWIEDHNYKGLLFCRQELIKFYALCGWKVIEPNKILFSTPHEGVFAMSYNCGDIQRLEYSDRFF